MNKLFCLIVCALCFSISASACITPFTKINLSKTSLEKNPITVQGKNIYFDRGSDHDEIVFAYDNDQKKWCVITSDKPGAPNCTVQFPTFVVNSKKEAYANIEAKGNKLTVFPVDKSEKKINAGKTYIEFEDSSNDIAENLDITSSSGAKISVSHRPGTRGLGSSNSSEILDLSKDISGSIGCGGLSIIPTAKTLRGPGRGSK